MVDENLEPTGDEPTGDENNDENNDEPTLFDAISDAIDEETIGLDADQDAPTGDDDDGTPTGETEDDPKEDSENAGGDDEPTGDEPTDGEGDDAPKDGDKDAVPGDDVSGDKDDAPPEDADGKTADHVNDPIPTELKDSTQERIRWLANRVKEVEAGATERTTELDEMITMVTETGTSGEQYGQVLGFMKLFNSTDEADQRAAFKVMQTELAVMAAKLGETIPGVDPLAAHEDLQKEVEAGSLTGDRAIEIANTRTREAASAAIAVTNDARTASESEISTNIDQGKAELSAYEKIKMASDPQWAAKKAILVPALRAVMRTVSPLQWKATFEESYDKLVLPKEAVKVPKPKVPVPLRPKAPAGEGSKQPSSMAEAIELSLGGSIDD